MILLRQGTIISPKNHLSGIMDLLIDGDKIVKIAPDLSDMAENDNVRVLDVAGMVVAPGLIDAHCHLCEPGLETNEDISTGTRAAVMGGFTGVACMPDTQPVISSASSVTYILDRARRVGAAHVYPVGALTRLSKGEGLSPIGDMKAAGAVAISDTGAATENASIMRNALKYASMFSMPVLANCEDKTLSGCGVMNEGLTCSQLGLIPIPCSAEESAVARNIILAMETDCQIHLCHISTARSVEIIRFAKKAGAKITAETCPQYFSLTDETVSGFNTMAKLNPPLRSQKDIDAIIEGLKDGTIDIIATDHTPCHFDSKIVEFDNAAFGMTSLETAFAVTLTYLYKTGKLTLDEIIYKMTTAPENLLKLSKSEIREGGIADIVVFDPDKEWTVDRKKLVSKGKNTPFDGKKLFGEVVHTIVGGELKVLDHTLVV